MKIGIEAQRIFRKNKHGMDIVAIQLIRHLQKIDLENEYYIFVQDGEDRSAIYETANFKIVRIKNSLYPYWEQVLLPKAIEAHGVELLHTTSNTAPLHIKIPLIITLHDIIYLENLNLTEGTYYQIFGNWYRRWNVPKAVKKSTTIITVSEYEKQQISHYFNLDNQSILTIYNGLDEGFHRVNNAQVLACVRDRYKLPDKFVFFLGNTAPKKNMVGVMKALSILRKRGQLDFNLLMLDIDRSYVEKMAFRIGDTEILNHIVITGYVPNRELPAIYSMATLFLYPSLRESFGIPILEAMACETPVITSNTSSMPEVAGDAAYFVDPYASDQIASAIHEVLHDKPLRKKLICKGLQRIKQFSWKDNALKTLSLYQSVLSTQSASPGRTVPIQYREAI